MYDVDFAKKLDAETSNVSIKGKVTYNLPPKHVVSKPDAQKNYDFWSQFLVIEDKTDSIGVNATFGHEEDKKKNGDIIEVKGEIHKYLADNKKTGKKEEKIVLNKAKIIEPEKPQEPALSEENKGEVKKGLQETKEGKLEQVSFGMCEQEMRKEAVIVAFDYGEKNDLAIYDCFDLAKTIKTYIESGKIDINVIAPPKKLELKQDKTDKEKLDIILEKAKEVDLADWQKITKFAVDADIFEVNIKTEEMKKRLCKTEALYNALTEALETEKDIIKDVKEQEKKGKDHTDEIPF